MSKKKNRTTKQNSHVPLLNLKPEVSRVNAAIKNIKDAGISTDIPDFDEGLAIKLIQELPEDAAAIRLWLTKFSELGKQTKDKLDSLGKDQEKLDSSNLELKDKMDSLAKDQEKLDSLNLESKKQKNSLEKGQEKLELQRADLVKREREILSRENDAKHEFAQLNENMLDQLRQETTELENTQRMLNTKLFNTKNGIHAALQARLSELDEKEISLDSDKATLFRKERRLDQALLDIEIERQENLEAIDFTVSKERERFEKQLENERKRAEKAFNASDNMREMLDEFSGFSKRLKGESPSVLIDELDELKREKQQLLNQISTSGQDELERENTALKQRTQALDERLRDIEPDYESAKAEVTRTRIATTEKQQLVETNKVLEKHKQVLTAHVNDLSTRIDQLTESQQAQNAFPALSSMDSNSDYQRQPHLDDVPVLNKFAPELQQRIAYAEKNVVLNYKLEDIQLLLGGLAMSQLHVFQGISGTGKTSLAKAFAKAMGGECITIPVQAGWRDRDDLLGHYNAFEKRFYEKDCLQGLYLAQTDAYKDRCNIILLDEMNLSRPEQYFSEFLSALEINNPDERLISLSESELNNAPRLLKRGRKIKVPENLWFIGTANQDETTNELADKTYDRAHVMVLPKHESDQELEKIQPQKFSYTSLLERFTAAQKEHASEVTEMLEELETGDLVFVLENSFDLGWGNRFEKQAKMFIPVVMAAGGDKAMALDHLLSTRVLRHGKVTGRYDTQLEDLVAVKDALGQLWKTWGSEPVKCFELLDKDIRSKDHT